MRAGWAAAALLAAVLFSSCGGGSDDPGAGGPPGRNTVVLRDISFEPEKLRVEAGDTVTWRFEDQGIPHDVKAEDGSFQSETKDSGTFRLTFEEPGTYTYICSLHPSQMKGTIEVRPG